MRCSPSSIERQGLLSLLRKTSLLFALGALCLVGGCFADCDGEPGVVRGVVVEAVDRDLSEIESLRIRDSDGRLWAFTTEEPLEKNGAHLRLHQVLGQTIEVQYEEREGRLVATGLRD